MTTTLEQLINNLKIELKNKNIKFKRIFNLIKNENHNEINKIIDNQNILCLIQNIVYEFNRIGNNMDKKLNNLIWINNCLTIFGEEPQISKTKAIKLLKSKVFINIYDLESEQYEKRTTRELLRKELIIKPERRFPLKIAKQNIAFKNFIIGINRQKKIKKN